MAFAWDDAVFRQRLEARSQELGRELYELLDEAGVDRRMLRHSADKAGRSADKIVKLAMAAQMNPVELFAEAIGGHLPATCGKPELSRLALVADVAAHLYVALAQARGGSETMRPTEIVANIIRVIDEPSEGS